MLLTFGVSCRGKTTLARQAAEILDGVMVRSDAVRKHLAGIPLARRGTETGTDIYTPTMTDRTYKGLLLHAREIVERQYATWPDRVSGAAISWNNRTARPKTFT